MNGTASAGTALTEPAVAGLGSPRLAATSDASAKRAASQISRAYKQASQFFLQRRFPESLFTIQPLITRRSADGSAARSDDGSGERPGKPPPIATASRAARVKVWSLYVTLLNSIVELGPDDGKDQFGNAQWRVMERKVRDGTVWEDIVQNGYGGVEGAVDPDVVSNLATLLLAQAPSQTLTQQRLEAYLAASGQPHLDVSAHFDAHGEATPRAMGGGAPFSHSGTATPRDLNSRIKILELYALHVLPRNDEWQYAKEFVAASDVLDDDTRDEFVQTLTALEDERAAEAAAARTEELRARAEAEERRRADQERRRMEEAQLERSSAASGSRRPSSSSHARPPPPQQTPSHDFDAVRSPSEKDYGIDDDGPFHPSRKLPGKSNLKEPRGAVAAAGSHAHANGTRAPGRRRPPAKKSAPPHGLLARGAALMTALQQTVLRVAQSMSQSPAFVLRLLLFIIALLIAMGREDVRQRLARILGLGWDSLRRTIGMGVKVSYV